MFKISGIAVRTMLTFLILTTVVVGDAQAAKEPLDPRCVEYNKQFNQPEGQECLTPEEKARAKAKRDAERRQATQKAEAVRLSKLPGVRIGMTPEQVRNESSWGAPKDINRTTTESGIREQWVYGGGNYLYFTNGKLTAIQN
jgi:hypothetical protein